jgi:tetratricopeptide (TPR) repeat protein
MENLLTRKNVLVLMAALVLAGAGTYLFQANTEKKNEEARAALYRVQKTFEDETKALTESEKAPGAKLDVDAKFPKTVAELNGILKSGSTDDRFLHEAAHRLGTLYLENGQPEKAASALKDGVQASSGGIQKASLQFLLGSALEQSSKFKDALEAFRSGLAQNVAPMKGDFLLGMMRAHLKLNETDQAKKVSAMISSELPGSKAAEAASQILKEMK